MNRGRGRRRWREEEVENRKGTKSQRKETEERKKEGTR